MKPTGQEKVKPTPTTPFLWFTAATMQQGKLFSEKAGLKARCWRRAWSELCAEDNRSSSNFEASWSGSLTERKSTLPGGTEHHGGRWCFLFGARVGRKRCNGEGKKKRKKNIKNVKKMRKKAFLSNK
ncbi:uncharacterized [Tachysurus ichikawai]